MARTIAASILAEDFDKWRCLRGKRGTRTRAPTLDQVTTHLMTAAGCCCGEYPPQEHSETNGCCKGLETLENARCRRPVAQGCSWQAPGRCAHGLRCQRSFFKRLRSREVCSVRFAKQSPSSQFKLIGAWEIIRSMVTAAVMTLAVPSRGIT